MQVIQEVGQLLPDIQQTLIQNLKISLVFISLQLQLTSKIRFPIFYSVRLAIRHFYAL